jgi:hypothetical protein
MSQLPETIRKALDVARNYHLIEEDEIVVDEDGCMYFERALREFAQSGGEIVKVLPLIPPFTTTCWKIDKPQANQARITWPWGFDPDQSVH